MDLDADIELMQELSDYRREVDGDEFDELMEEILAEADEKGYVHTQIRARLYQTVDMRRINDLGSVLGAMAEVQQIWRERSGDIVPELVFTISLQTGFTALLLLSQPAVALDQLDSIRALYEQQCRQAGLSLYGPHLLSMQIAARRGDVDEADRHMGLALAQPPEVGAGIPANFIEWLATRGDDAGAVRMFERLVIEDQKPDDRQACQAAAMLPLLRLGRLDEAEQMHRDSLDLDDLGCGDSPHLVYLALRGRLEEGLEVLAGIADEDPDCPETPYTRGLIAAHALPLLGRCQEAGRGAHRPEGFGGQTIDELAAGYRDEAERVARQLDEVNRMDVAGKRLHRFWQWSMQDRSPQGRQAPPTRLDPGERTSPGHAPW